MKIWAVNHPQKWGPVHTSLDSFTFTLSMCALYTSGLAMNAIPAESGASSAPDLDFMCSAEKLPSIMNVQISCLLWVYEWVNNILEQTMEEPYSLYFIFQSSGRLMPGWGHAGQKTAMTPSPDGPPWWPKPLCILLWRSFHWQDALRSCLYRYFPRC